MSTVFNYLDAKKKDLIRMLTPGFKKGNFYIRDDKKIGMRTGFTWNTPWIHRGEPPTPERNCILFHGVFLHYTNLIPQKCQECWKVVARPRTVKELFQLSELQKTSTRSCKAGIEKRPTVHGNYGAYWYNDSLLEGEECRQYVIDLVSQISPDIDVFLKRGCTEFEHKYGESHNWSVSIDNADLERLVTENVVIENAEPDNFGQPWYVKEYVRGTWVEFAHERGDETYLEFTGGKPLYPKYVTYESRKQDDVQTQ